jgi:hypothetical protein
VLERLDVEAVDDADDPVVDPAGAPLRLESRRPRISTCWFAW